MARLAADFFVKNKKVKKLKTGFVNEYNNEFETQYYLPN